MTAKQLTCIGVFHIEEAILDTLFQVDDEYTRTADIARAIGIKSWDNYDWIVGRILRSKLEKDKRVEARRDANGRKTGWKLTTLEKNRRADISSVGS